jgi:AI-2 transport protein TqsA
VFWGYLWGIPGMILSVPLLVITKLVLEQTSTLRVIARAMDHPKAREAEPGK